MQALAVATFLTRFSHTTILVHNRNSLRSSKIMQERAEADPKIRFAWNSADVDIHGDAKVSGIRWCDTVTGAERAPGVPRPVRGDRARPSGRPVQGSVRLTKGALPRRPGARCAGDGGHGGAEGAPGMAVGR
jgi:Pyridine nucleotide-disulphide oxidoreductase